MHVSVTQSTNTYETINSDKLDVNEISLPLLAEARTPTTVLIKGTTLTPATVANITFNIHQACVHHFYLYGEAPSKMGTFFRLQVHEKVRISQVEALYFLE